jgi:hypothetical protein
VIFPEIVFPNATAVAVSWLRDGLTEPVHARVPNPRPAAFVRVRRLGGPRSNYVTDLPMLTFEAWANSDHAAEALAQRARARLHSIVGEVVDGVPVYQVIETGGPVSLPDPTSDQDRYTFTAQVGMRGAPVPEPVPEP